MAKATLTFTDTDGNSVDMWIDFEPAVKRGDPGTRAQHAAAECMGFIMARARGIDALEEFMEQMIAGMELEGEDELDD